MLYSHYVSMTTAGREISVWTCVVFHNVTAVSFGTAEWFLVYSSENDTIIILKIIRRKISYITIMVTVFCLQVKEWFGTSCPTQPKTSPFALWLTASAISITSCSSTPTDPRTRFSPNITPPHSVSYFLFEQAAASFKSWYHCCKAFAVNRWIDCCMMTALNRLSPCACFKAKAVDGYVKPQIKQVVPE